MSNRGTVLRRHDRTARKTDSISYPVFQGFEEVAGPSVGDTEPSGTWSLRLSSGADHLLTRASPAVYFDVPSASSAAQRATQVIRVTQDATHATNHTLADLVAMLDERGREAMNNEEALLDAELTAQFEAGALEPLAYYRKLCSMTQEELAVRAGSTQAFISQIERGRRPLTLKQAKKFATALGVSAKQLLREE